MYALPWLPFEIYQDFPHIMSCLNISAMLLCFVLMAKVGKTVMRALCGVYRLRTPTCPQGLWEQDPEDVSRQLPWPYLFYRGVQINPRIAGVDVKQWTNSR